MAVVVYLVPVGRGHYELYSETPAHPGEVPDPPRGYLARRLHSARAKWHDAIEASRDEAPPGRFARWRAETVRRLAETMAEQRTLWVLRNESEARLVYPSDIEEPVAASIVRATLVEARRHHRLWLAFDAGAFVLAGLLMFLPGPNLVAYYFAFRLLGHYFSWRGARQALGLIGWTREAEPELAGLGALAALPRSSRDAEVDAIAARLNLSRLPAFFNRAAVPEA